MFRTIWPWPVTWWQHTMVGAAGFWIQHILSFLLGIQTSWGLMKKPVSRIDIKIRKFWLILEVFILIQVMQDMCAVRRIPCNPIWVRYPLLMGDTHQRWVGTPIQESTYVWPLTLDLIEYLHRFSYAHTNSHECILVLGKIAQSVRWWIIPRT